MNPDTTRQAGRREWIGLAVIALPCVVYAMDLTVLNLAVPHLSADLQPSSAQLLWIVDIYGFLVAGLLVTMGTLGDRIGRRRLLLTGAAAFGIASVLAAYSRSAEQLIAARALLGVAGATLAPSTLSLVRTMFADPRQRTIAVGVWISSFSAGGAVGPLLGGVLLEWFWWGSVFLLAAPVMALLLLIGPLLLPEYRDPAAGRLDLVSAGMSLAAVLAVIYGLKQLAQDGPGWPPVLSILAGLAVGIVFVRRQQAVADPLLDLRLFRIPAFSAALTTNILSFFVGFGALLFIAQYLQLVLGLSPLQAGLWMLPASGGFILGSMLTPVLVRRVRPVVVMAGGLAVAAVGFLLLTQLDSTTGLAMLVTGSVVFSLGLAPVDTLAADLTVGTASTERAGAASAISETGAEFGGALGIAILGVVGTAAYRSHVADAIPAGVSPQAAAAAQDTLGGAVAAAGQLPDPLGQALLGATREAFTQGLHLAFAVSAAAAIGTAILAVVSLRGVRSSPQPDGQPDSGPGPRGPRRGGRQESVQDSARTRPTPGSVQAEVFVVRMRGGTPELAGPCGRDPWYIEVGSDEDPVEVVTRSARNLMGDPLLVHSTSWRRAHGSVILSFVVVNRDDQAPELAGIPITRAELARSGATSAPTSIAHVQVLEHGLRHLAWLVADDELVRSTLSDEWKRVLGGYVPEPFRQLERRP